MKNNVPFCNATLRVYYHTLASFFWTFVESTLTLITNYNVIDSQANLGLYKVTILAVF